MRLLTTGSMFFHCMSLLISILSCLAVTNGNCKVPHQSSMLVLDCPGGKGVVIWQHEIYDLAAHHYHNVTICPAYQNRTCNVRGYKGHLSNGDSGPYYCIETETSARRVNVTILGECLASKFCQDSVSNYIHIYIIIYLVYCEKLDHEI